MRFLISWIDPHDGSLSGGVEWPGYFQETVPVVGDTIVESTPDSVGASEVVERYVYFTSDNEEVWHLVCKYVDLAPGRASALHLAEGRDAVRVDMATAEAHGITVERGTPFANRDD